MLISLSIKVVKKITTFRLVKTYQEISKMAKQVSQTRKSTALKVKSGKRQ